MGDRARLVVLATTLAAALSGCDDPVVVLGDWPGIMRVVAGVPDSTGVRVDSLATRTPLNSPAGLAATDAILYVADRRARVFAVRSNGRLEVLLDHHGCVATPACLGRPSGSALDGAGGLLLADDLRHRIWRLDLDTKELQPLAGNGEFGVAPDGAVARDATLAGPADLVVLPDGRIVFSERGAQRVRTIEPDGRLGTLVGDGTPGFGGDGGPARSARLLTPGGLALAEGVLYIADSGNDRVRAVDLDRLEIRTVAGSGIHGFAGDGGPAVTASLRLPFDVAVSHDGRTLFIAEILNDRVRAVNLESGIIHTFAGTGELPFNGTGRQAGETALDDPAALATSPLGFLYVAARGHHIIWRTQVRL